MIKRLHKALGILAAAGMLSVGMSPGMNAKAFRQALPKYTPSELTEKVAETTTPERDYQKMNEEMLRTAVEKYDIAKNEAVNFEFLNGDAPRIIEPAADKAELSVGSFRAKAPAAKAPGNVIAGSYVARNLNYKGVYYASPMKVAKDTTSTAGANDYIFTNIYGLGDTVFAKGTVNPDAGTVSIPAQVIHVHSTYGDVTMCPMTFRYGADGAVAGMSYDPNGTISGTVNASGEITLPGWGLLFTSNEKYQGMGFNFFTSSQWNPAILKAKGMKNGNPVEEVEYDIAIEQTSPATARLYCLSGVTGDVLEARLYSDKTIRIAPQKIYNNLFYGPFFIYAATMGEDGKVIVHKNDVLKGNAVSANEIDFGAWVISARSAPGAYVGYIFYNMKVNGPHGLTFPAPVQADFTGEGTEASPYLIKTIDDMNKLSQLVATGNDFKDKFFKLANDLDFSSLAPGTYAPVGDMINKFQGTFDGGNFTMKNLKIDGLGAFDAGIFGVIGESGTVKNLNVDKAILYNLGDDVGTIAGFNYGAIDNCKVTNSKVQSGGSLVGGIAGGMMQMNMGTTTDPVWHPASIKNCTFSGTVTGIGGIGGIAGQARGDIENCHVNFNGTSTGYFDVTAHEVAGICGVLMYAKVKNCSVTGIIQDSYGMAVVGGICGRGLYSEVENTYTTAALITKRIDMGTEGDNSAGGLVGSTVGTNWTNCFNAGVIIRNENSEKIGGLAGYLGVSYIYSGGVGTMSSISEFRNCYNSGQVLSPSLNTKKGIYGDTFVTSSWEGQHPEDVCLVSDNYYDAQISVVREDKYGRPTSFFTNGLPTGYDAVIWEAKAGCYPVLKALNGTQSAELAATAIHLREGDTAQKVKVSFTCTPTTNVDWLIHNGETLVTETDALKKDGNTFTVKNKYDNASLYATSADGNSLKMINLALVPKLFDGEGTAQQPYLLKNVADWKILAEAVGTYAQSHEGDFFEMTADVDFKGDESFRGIGCGLGASILFNGTLDGKNHTVNGMKQDFLVLDEEGKATTKSAYYTGLFGILGPKGTLRNIIIGADNDVTHYSYAGNLVGLSDGTIENCANYAEFKGVHNYVGGLVGVLFGGTMTGCYNAGTVTGGMNTTGGIVGRVQPGTVLSLCQNDGDVYGKMVNIATVNGIYNTIGGVAGSVYGIVDRCVNNGYVSGRHSLGGIAGETNSGGGEGIVKNCINNGYVNVIDVTNNRGGVVGYATASSKRIGNIYDRSINVFGSTYNSTEATDFPLYTAEMLSGKAPEGFPTDDFDFTAGKYPVLKAYKDYPATVVLRNMYVKFAEKQLRTNVLTEVELSAAEGTSYKLAVNENFKIQGNKLTITMPEGMKVVGDTITATNGNFVKSMPLSSIPKILEGDGVAESPYLIKTPADWNKLADFMFESNWEYPGDYFRIEADLDFKGDSIRCIGVGGTNFQGFFDGNNKTVKNYVYQNPNSIKTRLQGPNLYVGKQIGLFGTIGNFGEVKNMTIDGDFIAYQYSGAFVGENFGTIKGITVKGTVSNSTGSGMAGIAYRNNVGAKMIDCVFMGKVTAKTTNAAGIVYENAKQALVENCHNRGEVISTTTGACGIAYTNDGMLRGCNNEGTIKSLGATSGSAAGICYTLKVDGSMENCHNMVDIIYPEGAANIFGVLGGATAKATGHITNCSNRGNLFGKSYIYGFAGNLQYGLTITDCYNTGDVTAVSGEAQGFAGAFGAYGATPEFPSYAKNCYNTGNVTGFAAKCAGLFKEINKLAKVEDCYNFGDIITGTHTGLCQGGIAATISNGVVNRCFNAGRVSSSGNAVGGIAGYLATSGVAGPENPEATLFECYNIGDVTSTYQGTATQGNVGGLIGYLSSGKTNVKNCYNMGNVTGRRRVGGLIAGMFRPESEVIDCYNTGKVTATGTDPDVNGNPWYYWSGTIFTGNYNYQEGVPYFSNSKNVYYDKTVNPGKEFRVFPGSAKTTEELRAINFGENFVKDSEGYPVLKHFAERFKTDDVAKAMLVLHNLDNSFEEVKEAFTLVAPAGATWKAIDPETKLESKILEIKDNIARPVGDGKVILTVTDKENRQSKNFMLTLAASQSSIGDLGNDAGKEVKAVTFFDLSGRIIAAPEAGQVYVVRTVFTDGTMKVAKVVARD